MKKILVVPTIVVIFSIFAPSANAYDAGELMGNIFGSAVGGAIGSRLSDGDPGVTAAGAVAGWLLGGELGRTASRDDELAMNNQLDYARRQPWDMEQTYEWQGHYHGYYRPFAHGYYNYMYCRDYVHVFYDGYGNEYTRTVRTCQNQFNTWTIVQEIGVSLLPYEQYRKDYDRNPNFDRRQNGHRDQRGRFNNHRSRSIQGRDNGKRMRGNWHSDLQMTTPQITYDPNRRPPFPPPVPSFP